MKRLAGFWPIVLIYLSFSSLAENVEQDITKNGRLSHSLRHNPGEELDKYTITGLRDLLRNLGDRVFFAIDSPPR